MRVKNENCRFKSCTYGIIYSLLCNISQQVKAETSLCYYAAQPNFGVIEINWNANPASITLQVRDVKGSPVSTVTTSLSELHKSDITPNKSGRYCKLESDLPWLVRHRLAIFVITSMAGNHLVSKYLSFYTFIWVHLFLLISDFNNSDFHFQLCWWL